MFIQIGLFLLRLWKKDGGWTDQYAKRIGLIAFIVVLLIVVLPVAKCTYDNSVIDKHNNEIAADVRKADMAADEAIAADQKAFASEQARLEEAARNAKMQDPTGAAKGVGPVSRSYYDNLPENKR